MGFGEWWHGLFNDDEPQRREPTSTPPRGTPEANSRSAGNVAQLQHPGRQAQRWGNTAEIWAGLGQEKYRGSPTTPQPPARTLGAPAGRTPPAATGGASFTFPPATPDASILQMFPGEVPVDQIQWGPQSVETAFTPGAPPTPAPPGTGPRPDMQLQQPVQAPGVRPAPGLNRANRAILQSLGWELPQNERPVPGGPRTPAGLFDPNSKVRQLTPYTYDISSQEFDLLQERYGGVEGYKKGQGGQPAPKVQSDVGQAVPLTWDAYNALSDKQRRAVDFNTMLVDARERDLTQEKGNRGDDDYQKRVEAIFGKGGGSSTYAPNTLDMLEKIGFKAQGQDLDEFLSLDAMVSADELQNFNPVTTNFFQAGENGDLTADQYAQARSSGNRTAVQAAAIEKAGAFIDSALKKNPTAWDKNSAVTLALTGALPSGPEIPWGFGTDADRLDEQGVLPPGVQGKDQWMRDAYGILINPSQSMTDLWTAMDGMSDAEVQEVFQFFDQQSRRDIAIGVVDPAVLTPVEARKKAGLGAL